MLRHKHYPKSVEECTHPNLYENRMINRRCCPACGYREKIKTILCSKCKTGEMEFSRTCGVMVCQNPECREHEGLGACFCNWNSHLLDPHEDDGADEPGFFDY
jgi:hypothetical protein